MGFTGFDQANFWEDGERIIGHGWACVAWMESGERCDCSFPDCIRAKRPAPRSRLREKVTSAAGSWQGGDHFYLMTDALAAWFLREHEAGGRPWRRLEELDHGLAFARWVDELRRSHALRNDDVTLLRLIID